MASCAVIGLTVEARGFFGLSQFEEDQKLGHPVRPRISGYRSLTVAALIGAASVTDARQVVEYYSPSTSRTFVARSFGEYGLGM